MAENVHHANSTNGVLSDEKVSFAHGTETSSTFDCHGGQVDVLAND